MYLCLCKAVRVREVQRLVREHDCSAEEVARCTGAGTCCGTCVDELVRVVQDERREPLELAAK
jgi:bacterioferritin-associated ferredoxin